jgi:hypothetical protein
MTSPNLKAKNWKQYILNSKEFNYPTNILKKIKAAGTAGITGEKIFSDFSRNNCIAFLSLDASEQNLQLLHHPTILGGSWLNEELKMTALIGMGQKATPVKVVPKSLKDIKTKAPKPQDIISAIQNRNPLREVKTSNG